MKNTLSFAQELIDFIDESPTPYQAVKSIKKILDTEGFSELSEKEEWDLQKEGKYYVARNDSALISFIIGTGEIEEEGFKIIGAHTDSPTFKIKPAPEMEVEKSYIKLNTEAYGGVILNTWLDRPLSIAGRVSLKAENPLQPRIEFIHIRKPLLIIPNLAIHLNKQVNEGVALNKQKDMLPLLCTVRDQLEQNGVLLGMIAEELQVKEEEIIDFDLFLYECQKGSIIGMHDEFISASRLDNLAMTHAGIVALSKSSAVKATNMMVCFDNEEVGSATKQGADSPFLRDILERIVLSLGKGRKEYLRAIANSFMISADMAHALHPNTPEKHDPVNKPILNKGPVIKMSASQSYTSDSESIAVYEMICEKAGVPVQKFVNRSDERGGSTIGPITSTQLGIRSIDIGNPTLAMHSVRELCGVQDHLWITYSFMKYYEL